MQRLLALKAGCDRQGHVFMPLSTLPGLRARLVSPGPDACILGRMALRPHQQGGAAPSFPAAASASQNSSTPNHPGPAGVVHFDVEFVPLQQSCSQLWFYDEETQGYAPLQCRLPFEPHLAAVSLPAAQAVQTLSLSPTACCLNA